MNNINLSYSQLKEITEGQLRKCLKNRNEAEYPYDRAKFHAQSIAILNMWQTVALTGNANSDEVFKDYVYFNSLIE